MKLLLPALAGAVLLSIQPAPASAAPSLAGAAPMGAEAREGSLVEKTVVHCWWQRGVRRCRWVQGVPPPEAYRTGTAEWWRAMQDWGRTGGGRR